MKRASLAVKGRLMAALLSATVVACGGDEPKGAPAGPSAGTPPQPAADAAVDVPPSAPPGTPPGAPPTDGPGAKGPRVVPMAVPRAVSAEVSGVSSVQAVDFDGDGRRDVLVGGYGAGRVAWYRNLGGGQYGPENPVEPAAQETWFSLGADLDGDGDPDVVIGRYTGELAWYENDGAGRFTRRDLDTGVVGPWLAVGDLDGDGVRDLVAAPDGGSEVLWYRGLGDKSFAPRAVFVDGLAAVAGVRVLDLNGDGRDDCVVGGGKDNTLRWYFTEAGGKRGAAGSSPGGEYLGVADMADLDGDGLRDVVTLEYVGEKVAWYPALAGGGFGARRELPLAVKGPYAVAAADFDGDGRVDVSVATYSSQGSFTWLRNRGDGTFDEPVSISSALGQVSSLAADDVDGDGDADLVAGSFSGSRVWLFENRVGASAMTVLAPPDGRYLEGQRVEIVVHFGYPVTVTGRPTVRLRVGARDVRAEYAAGSGSPQLTFRYVVQGDDVDDDGVALLSSVIDTEGASLRGPYGQDAERALTATSFANVKVLGNAPYVTRARRLDATPTADDVVRFRLVWNKPVRDLTPSDITLQTTGDLRDARVVSVQTEGSECDVTVATGKGSGTLGLAVRGDAPVADRNGNALGAAFRGGEVYTLLRGPARTIREYFRSGHGDIAVGYAEERWTMDIARDDRRPLDQVLLYGGAQALVPRPEGAGYDALGVAAGAPVYIWPQDGSVAEAPDLGLGGSGVAGGTFARYRGDDPRAPSEGAWIGVRLVGMRGPPDGHFTMYRAAESGPLVWLATSDGLTQGDTAYILEGSHQHYSFAFTRRGVYEVDLVASGYRDANNNGVLDPGIDPYVESGVMTVYFAVDPPGGPQPYTIAPGMGGR